MSMQNPPEAGIRNQYDPKKSIGFRVTLIIMAAVTLLALAVCKVLGIQVFDMSFLNNLKLPSTPVSQSAQLEAQPNSPQFGSFALGTRPTFTLDRANGEDIFFRSGNAYVDTMEVILDGVNARQVFFHGPNTDLGKYTSIQCRPLQPQDEAKQILYCRTYDKVPPRIWPH